MKWRVAYGNLGEPCSGKWWRCFLIAVLGCSSSHMQSLMCIIHRLFDGHLRKVRTVIFRQKAQSKFGGRAPARWAGCKYSFSPPNWFKSGGSPRQWRKRGHKGTRERKERVEWRQGKGTLNPPFPNQIDATGQNSMEYGKINRVGQQGTVGELMIIVLLTG